MSRGLVGFASRACTRAVAAALIATPLFAQSQTSEKEWHSRWSASFGVDPFKMDGTVNVSENFAAALAKQWSRPGSRLGFRAQLSGGREPSIRQRFNVTECGDCSLTRTVRYAEFSGTAVYTFRNNRRLRPYLLGGPGVYRVSTAYLSRGLVIGNGESQSVSSVWSFGLTAGAGASLRLFGKELFLEQRILWPQASTGASLSPVPHPLSIGVKFEK